MKPISRRTLLRGAGGAAIPLPFLDLMARPRTARAASISKTGPNGAPKRFLMFFTPCGQGPDFLHCTNEGGKLVLAPALKPLDRHAGKLLVFTGINNQAALHDPAGIDPGHQKPSVTASTCVSSDNGDGGGASIDQAIAKAISPGTKIPSIELGVATRSSMSWGAARTRLPAIDDPAQAFTKLFSDVNTSQTALARINAERKSILDGVKQDYAALIARMGAEDQRKLSSHLDGIREIETRLDAAAGAVCSPGQAPASTRDFVTSGDLHMAIVATAFACDVTRVGSLTYQGQGGNYLLPGFPKGIHDASHDYGSAGWPVRNRYSEWFCGRFAMLLDKLAAVDEGGRSVLDNTIVYWFSEHGCGNHNYDMMPIIVAGSGGDYFKTGRQITLPNGTDGLNYVQYNAGADKATGPSQSDLFVSFLNAVGVEATSFGDPKLCKGPIAGLTG